MSKKEIVFELAEKCLNEKGLEDVELLLSDDKIDVAKAYVLGAIDSLWKKNCINDNEAAQAYQLLGVEPSKASQLRQNSPHWK